METRVQVDDVELAVDEAGSGGALVWGHGLTSSRAHEDEIGFFDWRSLVDRVRLVRYDAHGHGVSSGTPEPDSYRWASLAGDMLAVADGVGADRFVAGGASMGCATALFVAVEAPERVRGLVLATPPTAWETRRAQSSMYEAGAELVESGGIPALLDVLDQQPPPPLLLLAAMPELHEVSQRHAARLDPDLLPSILRGAARSDLPPPEAIQAIAVPTLVLAWDGDPGHPVSTAERLAELLPVVECRVARTAEDIQGWPDLVRRHVTAL